jgi:hypothetical protein
MNEAPGDVENYEELKFSREQGFFDKNLVVRWGIGLAFLLSLFVFLHFREIKVEVFELNSIAPSYVVTQVDIDYFDEEATIILRQDAVKYVGKVYQVSEKILRQRRNEFENFLIYSDDWRKADDTAALTSVYQAVDAVAKALAAARFTDPRTLQQMGDAGLPSKNFQVFTPADTKSEVILPPQIWTSLKQTILESDEHLSEQSLAFVLSFFANKKWGVDEDVNFERNLRKRLQSKVPDKYSHLSAGSRIVDQGERVTTRNVAMLQAMQKALNDERNPWHPLTLLGSFLLSLILTVLCAEYLRHNQPQIIQSNRKLFLLVTVLILTMGVAKLLEFIALSTKSNLIDLIHFPLFVPFAAILTASLLNAGTAMFASGFLAIILMFALVFDPQGLLLVNLTAAIVAILNTRSLKRRKEIFILCAKAWAAAMIVTIALLLYRNTFTWGELLTDTIVSSFSMLLTAILVVGLLPILESAFKIMTDVTMMEYMDPDNDVLRRLTIEAPGTYQHSVVVGNLAEAAALAIGANGLFCRVSTLYHDIGKMVTPQYFTENQQGGVNIHQLLTPRESAHVIIAHVSEGVAIARKAGLPEQFIDIIKEHHGTSLAYYFYRKELEKVGGDPALVDERDFRYAGPTPRSKESAIIMIADSLEAASRSLEKMDEENLMELANRLVRDKMDDGQFDHCLLTFEELAIIKKTLVKTLLAFTHSRVKYPKRELKPEETEQPPSFEA